MLAAAAAMAAGAAPALATPTQFTPGDLVIYETQGTSSAAAAVDLVDYSTAGVPSGFSVALPTADSGATHALVESGSALNDGELTDSADGQSLVATGYDAAVGTASITSATSTPRTVAIVSPTGTVDTSTSLTDTTTESNNFRSATMPVTGSTGSTIYTSDGAGVAVAADGGSSATYLNSDNAHDVLVVGGELYESTTSAINQVGTGLPTSGTQTDTALVGSTNALNPTKFDPDQFALVTLGTGTAPNTLYVADGAGGSKSGGNNFVEKYSLESGAWVLTGDVSVPQVVGLAVSVSAGVASIYVTCATSATAGNNTILDGITDSSGFEGSLTGATVNLLATAPSGTDFKGLAFAPIVSVGNQLPEAPLVIALPLLGMGAFAVYALRLRRRAA
jgi:hypothetical protein